MKRKIVIIAVLVLVALLGTRILTREKSAPLRMQEAHNKQVEQSVADEQLRSLGYISETSGGQAAGAQQKSPVVRKVILSGEVSLQVKSLDSFSRLLDQKVRESGGYIAGIDVNRNSANSYAVITVKLVPASLDRFTGWLKETGNVTNEKLNTEDISAQYYDLQARLANSRKLEKRLLEMVETHTAKLSDLLEVEEKLSDVRESIESMEANLRTYDHLVNLATVTLHVSTEARVTESKTPYFQQLKRAWHNSTASLGEFAGMLGIAAVALVPWLLVLVPMMLLAGILLKLSARFWTRWRTS